MGMADVGSAASMRKAIEKIASNVVTKMRPEIRKGRIFSYDADTGKAYVLFPGNTIDSLVPVNFSRDKIPSQAMADTFEERGYDAPGDIVRVAGKPNDWFILDYASGVPASEYTNVVGKTNFYSDELVVTALADQQDISLTYLPIAGSEHVYWGGAQLPDASWTRDEKIVSVVDPDHIVKIGRKLIVRYAWDESSQGPGEPPSDPPPVYSSLEFIGYSATNAAGLVLPFPDGTQAGDLFIMALGTGGLAGSNPVITDSRFTGHLDGPTDSAFSHYAIGYGIVGSDTSDIAMGITDGEGNGGGLLVVYRFTGTLAASFSQGHTGSGDVTVTPMIPTMAVGDRFAIVTAGYTSDIDIPGTWNARGYRHGSSMHLDAFDTLDSTTYDLSVASDFWMALVIGIAGSN